MTTNVQNLNRPKLKICPACLTKLQQRIKESSFDYFLHQLDESIAFARALDFLFDQASTLVDFNYIKSCILCELEQSKLIWSHEWLDMTSLIACETIAGKIPSDSQIESGNC